MAKVLDIEIKIARVFHWHYLRSWVDHGWSSGFKIMGGYWPSPMARLVTTCFFIGKILPKNEIKNKNFKNEVTLEVFNHQKWAKQKGVDITIFLYLVFLFVTKKTMKR
jgi:hypothetical protein